MKCLTTSFCVLSGSHDTPLQGIDAPLIPFVSVYNGTNWSTSDVSGTTNLDNSGSVNSISCISPTFCVVGGTYLKPIGQYTGIQQGFISIYNGSAWSGHTILTPSLIVNRKPYKGSVSTSVNDISCISSSLCFIGGEYSILEGLQTSALVSAVKISGSKITYVESQLARTISSAEFAGEGAQSTISSISCVTSKFCVAGGGYTQSWGYSSFISTFNGNTWNDKQVAKTVNLKDNSIVHKVTCLTISFCVAGGDEYVTSSDVNKGFVSVYK